MATNMVKLELPTSAYEQLQELAAAEQKAPIEVITELWGQYRLFEGQGWDLHFVW